MVKVTPQIFALGLATVLVTGCTGSGAGGTGGPDTRMDTAKAAATALTSGNFDNALTATEAATVKSEYAATVEPLEGAKPTVTAVRVADEGNDKSTAILKWSWPLAEGTPWEYESTAPMNKVGDKWQWQWSPAVVHSELGGGRKFIAVKSSPKRGKILGNGGAPLVEDRAVVHVGLNKATLKPTEYAASAKAIAALPEVDIDAAKYLKDVEANGPEAFVVAITLRGSVPPKGLDAIPGGFTKNDVMMLGPTRTFAKSILGSTGVATAEEIEKGKGTIAEGDIVGRGGLQGWHDKTLRGVKGMRLFTGTEKSKLPTDAKPLYVREAVDGKDLKITLDLGWQTHLETVLGKMADKKAVTVIEVGTGRILAMGGTPAVNDEPWANWGHYPPASTMKIASSLAMVRGGKTPESTVTCKKTYEINGISFKNYPEYPANMIGNIPLKEAFANSCNTVFMDGILNLPNGALAEAAGSLGVGDDYDAGFQSFYGKIPPADNPVDKATQGFGQSTVEQSPMSVAGMSASVASGKTIVPWLVEGFEPKPKGKPLAPNEAAALQTMMNYMVASNHVPAMVGVYQGAKSGTAEFGDIATNTKVHTWMTGYTSTKPGGVAVSMFAWEGRYGADMAPFMAQVAQKK